MGRHVVEFPTIPKEDLVVAALNFAIATGPLDCRIPLAKNTEKQARDLITTLSDHVVPPVFVHKTEPINVGFSEEDGHLVVSITPHSQWPSLFLCSSWAKFSTGPRAVSCSAQRWITAAASARPRWALAARSGDSSCLAEKFKTTVGSPFEYKKFPPESPYVGYKISGSWPLQPENVRRIVDKNLLPILRAGEDCTFTIGVHDSLAPQGVILSCDVEILLYEAKEELVTWFLGLWPPLDVKSIELQALPAPVVEGCLEKKGPWASLSSQELMNGVTTQRGPFEILAQETERGTEYCVFVPVEDGTHDYDDHERVDRYLLQLTIKWQSVDSNPLLVRHCTMTKLPRFTLTSEGVEMATRALAGPDLWLWAHRNPTPESMDTLLSEMTMVVVVAFGSGEGPPLPPGVLPGIVLDISIKEDQHHLVELMLHSPQLNCVLLVDCSGMDHLAKMLNLLFPKDSEQGSPPPMLLQGCCGREVAEFLLRLAPHHQVLDLFSRTPALPLFETVALRAKAPSYTAKMLKYRQPRADLSSSLASAHAWIEGQGPLSDDVVMSHLSVPLGSQVDRVAEWIEAVTNASSPQVEVLVVGKLFLCCGASSLLRMAVFQALEACPKLTFWDLEQMDPASLSRTSSPTVFIMEEATAEFLDDLKRVTVSFPVAVLTSTRTPPVLAAPGTFLCSPIVAPSAVEPLCTALATMYPRSAATLRRLHGLADFKDPTLRHVLVFVMTAFRSSVEDTGSARSHIDIDLDRGIATYVATDIAGIRNRKSKEVLFALAFVAYFSEGDGASPFLPFSSSQFPRELLQLLRPGSLLREDAKKGIGFWHPWVARLVLTDKAIGLRSWLYCIEKGLVRTLSLLDDLMPATARRLALHLLVDRPHGRDFRFSKLVDCYRNAVRVAQCDPADHFPIDKLVSFMGTSRFNSSQFRGAMHLLLSRMYRLNYCPDYRRAIEEAERALEVDTSFTCKHNLARATTATNPRRALKLLHELYKEAKSKRKHSRDNQRKKILRTAKKAINKLPKKERLIALRTWQLPDPATERQQPSSRGHSVPATAICHAALPCLSQADVKALRAVAEMLG